MPELLLASICAAVHHVQVPARMTREPPRSTGQRQGRVTEQTDRELWIQALAGNDGAFGVLFERHARAIYNYCFRRTANWTLAEDLTSVVFLEAWRRRKEALPPDGSLLPWLYGIATNLLRNLRRTQRRYRAVLSRFPAPSAIPDFSEDLAGRVDAERRMRSLLALLGNLSREDQDLLALCGWCGLTYQETAAALGIPEGTVRSRLHRARRRLRELEGSGGQESEEVTAAVAPDGPRCRGGPR